MPKSSVISRASAWPYRPALSLACLLPVLAISACQDRRASAQADIAAARSLYERHDLIGAREAIERAIKADVRSRSAHQLAAQIHSDLGDLPAAVGEYDRVDMLDPTDKTARLKTVDILIKANVLDAAAARVNATIGDQPNNIDALGFRALIEARQAKLGKARADAQAVLAKAPSSPSANAALAELALRDGKSDEALGQLKTALAKHPDDATLLLDLANAYQAKKAPDQVMAVFDTLVKLEPATPAYRMLQANLQAAQGRVDDGEKTLRAGLALAPQSRTMRLGLVGYLAQQDKTAAAEAELRAGIAAAKDDAAFDLTLAELMAKEGRGDEAVPLLRATVDRLKDKPAQTSAQLGLARLLAARGNTADALTELDSLLKAKPTDDAALMLRADLLLRTAHGDRAVTDLTGVTNRQPTNAPAFELLARAYDLQGKTDEALDALKRSADLRPADLEPVLRVADVEHKLGRDADAKALLADFISRNPSSIEGRTVEIRFLLSSKDWNTAQSRIDQLSQQPNAANTALALTAELKERRNLPAEAAALYKRLIVRPGSTKRADEDAAKAFIRTSIAAHQETAAAADLQTMAETAGDEELRSTLQRALAALYAVTGNATAASETIDKAIVSSPKIPDNYLAKVALLRTLKRPDDALAALTAGIAAGAPRAPLLYARGDLQIAMAHPDQAIVTYGDILKDDAKALLAANNLASLLCDQKPIDRQQLTEARDRLTRLAPPDSPAIVDTLAWADYRLGDPSAAKALLERIHADHSAPQLRYHYGAVLMATGDKENGRALIKAVLSENFPGREEAQGLVTN